MNNKLKRPIAVVVIMVMVGLCLTNAVHTNAAPLSAEIVDYNSCISAGDNYCMAILKDNSLWGWGHDNGVHLGQRYLGREFIYKPEKIMDNAKSVYAGWGTTLVIKTDNTLWAWGDNMPGAGEERITYAIKPEKVMNSVISTASGHYFVVAVKSDNTLWGWGNNIQVQFNTKLALTDMVKNSYRIYKPVLKPMMLMNGAKKVVADRNSYCVLKTDGTLLMHGGGVYGSKKTKINNMEYNILAKDVKDVFMLQDTVYYIKTNDSLWGIGYKVYKNLGKFDINKQSAYDYTPVKVMDGVKAAAASEGLPLLILKKDGKLYASEMCGVIDEMFYKKTTGLSDYSKNKTIKLMNNVLGISAGSYQYLVYKDDGTIWTWGMNMYGGLGDGQPASNTIGKSDFILLDFPASEEQLFIASEQKSKLFSDWKKEKEQSGEIPAYNAGFKANWIAFWDENVINGMRIKKFGNTFYGYNVWGALSFVAATDGNKLKGRTSESIFELTMMPDGKSFIGLIFINSGAEAEIWKGTKAGK